MTDNSQIIDQRFDAPGSSYGEGQSLQSDIRQARIEAMATGNDAVYIAEPPFPSHPVYPNNDSYLSPCGHLQETDDTPGAERLLSMHKSGTFVECHPDGSRVTKIFGKDFYICLDDHQLFVAGTINITCQSNVNMLVKGDLTQKIGGNLTTTVLGNHTTRVGGKSVTYSMGQMDIQSMNNILVRTDAYFQVQSKLQMKFQSAANIITRAATTTQIWSDGETFVDGSQVHWNLPGVNPHTDNLVKKDIGPGLNIPSSLITPSVDSMLAVRTDNSSLVSTLSTTDTYPKDRIKVVEVPAPIIPPGT